MGCSLASYARMPVGDPFCTNFFNARLLGSPVLLLKSACLRRQLMHQQPPQAPRSPNNVTRSFQRSDASGWKVSADVARVANLAFIRPRFRFCIRRLRGSHGSNIGHLRTIGRRYSLHRRRNTCRNYIVLLRIRIAYNGTFEPCAAGYHGCEWK